jgi:coenzyme F420-dependent glucose-6-phosphate dehydrogenase
MTRFFFHASQEQFPPDECLQQAIAAVEAGFDGIASADHLQPWWEPGEAGHLWPWLGACLQATEKVPVGPAVTTPGKRYHPAMIAQAWMTMEVMFPGRVFLGIGSGEALNEVPLGDEWPSPGDKVRRFDEALSIIDRLWKGETLSEEGRFFTTKDCKLHTLADRRPPIYVSAFGPQAAEVAGRWGDGLWTLGDPESAPEIIETYREARKAAGKGGDGEIIVQVLASWAESDEQALEGARVWKGAQPDEFFTDDWHKPQEMYEEGARQTSDEDLKEAAIISADPDEHVRRIRELIDVGATVVNLQCNSGLDPMGHIRTYGEHVLPKLRGA